MNEQIFDKNNLNVNPFDFKSDFTIVTCVCVEMHLIVYILIRSVLAHENNGIEIEYKTLKRVQYFRITRKSLRLKTQFGLCLLFSNGRVLKSPHY